MPEDKDKKSAPTDEDKAFQTKLQKLKKDVSKAFKKYTETYFKDAQDTDCVPTEDQAVEEIFKSGQPLFEGNETYEFLTVAQQKQAMEYCRKDIETDVRAQYRNYVDKYHPAVNGKSPYHVPDNTKKELTPYIKDIEAHMSAELNDFLDDCARHGICPNQKQMTACYEGWMTKYKKEYGPKFKITENAEYWMRHELLEYFDTLDKTYHAYADTVKITDSYPDDYVGVTVSAPPRPGTKQDGKVKAPGSSTTKGQSQVPPPPVTTQTPKQTKKDYGPKASLYTKTNVSFSGCDMVVSANMKTTDGHVVSVVVGSAQTVSYSIYRKLSPILNIGNVNAKDYVGGPRTIAGSLIFTVFHQHWASELVDEFMEKEGYAATRKVLMDDLAPIDLTIAMANEYGVTSRLAIYGIRLFKEGQVMSINDIYTENTYEYVALNIDYLANINAVSDVWSNPPEKGMMPNSMQTPSQQAGITPPGKGDTSRTTSSAPKPEPKTEPEKEKTGTAKHGKEDEMKPEPEHKDSKVEVDKRVGKEIQNKNDDKRKSASGDSVEGISAPIQFRNKTRSECKDELTGQLRRKQAKLRAVYNQGKITKEEFFKQNDELTAQFNEISQKIDEHYDEEFKEKEQVKS